MRTIPSKYDDVIDSRDIIARIDTLREEREDFEAPQTQEASEDEFPADTAARYEAWAAAHPEDAVELAALEALASEAEGYAADWQYGEMLIRDSYFKEYAQEFAEDIGAIPANAQWPCTCIDWDQAARELQMDYTAVEFDGVTYWVR